MGVLKRRDGKMVSSGDSSESLRTMRVEKRLLVTNEVEEEVS